MRQRVKRVAHLAGLELARWRSPEQRLGDFLARHSVDVVLDVGASGGQFGHALRSSGFTGRIISFEPLAEPFRILSATAERDPLWEVHQLALGETPGRHPINVAGNTTSSSFLSMAEQHGGFAPASRFVGVEYVQVARLDDLAPTLAVAGSVLLKIDVQGFHLRVLNGGAALLAKVSTVQCEVSLLPLYEGEPPLLDALLDLRKRGFELVELEPGFYDPVTGCLLQFDGRFAREVSNGAPTISAKRDEL